jgi:SAM-dependent methyltransferase
MERAEWLVETRRRAEERFDTRWAPVYDANWGGTIEAAHLRWIDRFLEHCPTAGLVLDAACGTGKYWHLLLESGRRVFGIDQSAGMLSQARAKFPAVPVEKLGLQELRFERAFDAALCMDALEMVFPEHWPLVLENLHRSLKPGAPLYFTVEQAEQSEIEQAYQHGRQQGLPVVFGECASEDGYHYYPELVQVRTWISGAGFELVQEGFGDLYEHFLVRRSNHHL